MAQRKKTGTTPGLVETVTDILAKFQPDKPPKNVEIELPAALYERLLLRQLYIQELVGGEVNMNQVVADLMESALDENHTFNKWVEAYQKKRLAEAGSSPANQNGAAASNGSKSGGQKPVELTDEERQAVEKIGEK